MKHTPTPWHVCVVDDKTTFTIESQSPCSMHVADELTKEDAERIVACVNAFEGIQDPALYMLVTSGKGQIALSHERIKQQLDEALEQIAELKKQNEIDPINNDPDEAIDDERLP